ncbi:putative necrosis-inducing factor-domain-containing protein [Staphylotrichum tortipilum]|uniref:Necrosis-inducing factor-domain-containing protein n=1 Tax=Staphylotrichum tortipilum TaxID=2831512 RepID=A0AAN6MBQ4_9PEZI|nr:putative necrosis-inducing factor-domain-containing protein [Staphylotrichum longicolle]
MQLTKSLAFLAAALALGVDAAPVADPQSSPGYGPNPSSPDTTRLNKRLDKCGGSTFTGETSSGSPLIVDCQQLANNLSGSGSWWFYVWAGTKELARYGTCRFMSYTVADFGVSVGDLDVKDLIRNSIAKVGRDGRVGAKGSMNCYPGGDAVWWYIWHT